MNYKKIYENLISKRLENKITNGYYETHHILPKCLGGGDSPENLIRLTYREHFIAHWLLYKIHGGYKLASAFNMMRVSDGNQKRYSIHYKYARKAYIDSHPCKDDVVKNKISESLKEHYHRTPKEKRKRVCPVSYCIVCNCTIHEKRRLSARSKYCSLVCRQNDPNVIRYKERKSKEMKKYISNLSTSDKKKRLAKSIRKCDNNQRIQQIKESRSKTPDKIRSMSDNDFFEFISKMKPYRSDGARNGNITNYLKMRGLDVDRYYNDIGRV